MVETKEVIAFFDRLAPSWDADMIRNDEVIGRILDGAGVQSGKHILDVACGTGVLIPDYLARDVASVTGIDISKEMAKIAGEKFREDPRVRILCTDAESLGPASLYDCVMVYNALPHFPDPERLVKELSALVAPGGTLTFAHGMSKAMIDRHHTHVPENVSNVLPEAESLAEVFRKYLEVRVVISDDTMYQVTGTRS